MKEQGPFIYRVVSFVSKILHSIFNPLEIKGLENVPEGKLIVCCNHLSWKDPFILGVTHKRQVNFMAKAELFKNKIIAAIIRALGGFPVNRGTSDRSALSSAETVLNSDKILGIFIEGTRSKTGELLKPKPGAVLIAYHCNSPIIPMCITPKGGGKIRPFKRIIVSCGEPIYIEDLGIIEGKSSEIRKATRLVMEKIIQLRERDLES